MKKSTIVRALVIAGALPFVVGAVVARGPDSPAFLGIDADLFLASYGGVILAFLGGIHWGQHLDLAGESGRGLLLLSNVIALAAWASILLESVSLAISLLILAVGFLVQLLVDRRLLREAMIGEWYFRLRAQVTAVVVACLLVPAAGLLRAA